METRAKFALIGVFTLCVIAAAFGFVFWFSGSRGGANLKSYQVVFDTPVTGLSRGGAVLFNGIRVGEVTDLSFYPRDPRLVVARVDIAPDVPIKVSTKARLEFSGLTGVASVQIFDFRPEVAGSQAETGRYDPHLARHPHAEPPERARDGADGRKARRRHPGEGRSDRRGQPGADQSHHSQYREAVRRPSTPPRSMPPSTTSPPSPRSSMWRSSTTPSARSTRW